MKSTYRKRGRKLPTVFTHQAWDIDVASGTGTDAQLDASVDATIGADTEMIAQTFYIPKGGFPWNLDVPSAWNMYVSCEKTALDSFAGSVIVALYPTKLVSDIPVPDLAAGTDEVQIVVNTDTAFFGDKVLAYGYIDSAVVPDNTNIAYVQVSGWTKYASNWPSAGLTPGQHYALVITTAGTIGAGVEFEYDADSPIGSDGDTTKAVISRARKQTGVGVSWELATWGNLASSAADCILIRCNGFSALSWVTPTYATGTIKTYDGTHKAKDVTMVPEASGVTIDPRDIEAVKLAGYPVDLFIEGFNLVKQDGLSLSGGIMLYLNGSTTPFWNADSENAFLSMVTEQKVFTDGNDTYIWYKVKFNKVIHLSAIDGTAALGIQVGTLTCDGAEAPEEGHFHVGLNAWEIPTYYVKD